MTEWVVYNSHQEFYKEPFGAVTCGELVSFTLAIDDERQVEQVDLVVTGCGFNQGHWPLEPAEYLGGKRLWRLRFSVPNETGIIWYHFKIRAAEKIYYYGNNWRGKGGGGQLTEYPPKSYQLTVYRQQPDLPGTWFTEGVVYHLFVDRFFNGNDSGQVLNPKLGSLIHGRWEDTPVYLRDREGRIVRWDFFGGNLLGVRKKLSYLQDLGVTAIYLSPIFLAPSNHKYDTADYLQIDPMFGTEEDLRELCHEASEMGMHVILDGVFSHTGSDSIYFNKEGNFPSFGACQSKDSPYYSWYRFTEYPTKYDCWWGIDTLPNVNEMEPSYRDFILHNPDSVIKHWMRAGIRGWRLDVADELPTEFLKEFHRTVKEMDHEAVVIGEVWEDASNKASYGEQRQYFAGDQLDGVTNYPFRRILLDFVLGHSTLEDTHYNLMSLIENYPAPNLAASFSILGSHDVPRALTLLGTAIPEPNLTEQEWEHYRLEPERYQLAKKRLKLLSLFQFSFPGVPCIYYGDEAGMEGYRDPYNRGPYPWGQEDKELLKWYQEISRLRRECDVLKRGDWFSLGLELGEDNPGTRAFGFRRRLDDRVALALFNPDEESSMMIKVRQASLGCSSIKEIWQGQELLEGNGDYYHITLKPLEGRIFIGKTR